MFEGILLGLLIGYVFRPYFDIGVKILEYAWIEFLKEKKQEKLKK